MSANLLAGLSRRRGLIVGTLMAVVLAALVLGTGTSEASGTIEVVDFEGTSAGPVSSLIEGNFRVAYGGSDPACTALLQVNDRNGSRVLENVPPACAQVSIKAVDGGTFHFHGLDQGSWIIWAYSWLGGLRNGEYQFSAVDGGSFERMTTRFTYLGTYEIDELIISLGGGAAGDMEIEAIDNIRLELVVPPVATIANAAASEGAGTVDLTVSLDKPWTSVVSVDWTTVDNTAVSPDDYAAASGTVAFPVGSTTQTVSVLIADDNIDEPSESFRVQLSNPANCTIGGTGRATGTIRDDDATPRITIIGATWWENVGSLRFPVVLDRPSSRTVTVNYGTMNWTAAAPGDYVASAGTVSFPPGSTVQYISVPVVDDASREGVENFKVKLSSPVFANLAPLGIGVGTVIDNDLAL